MLLRQALVDLQGHCRAKPDLNLHCSLVGEEAAVLLYCRYSSRDRTFVNGVVVPSQAYLDEMGVDSERLRPGPELSLVPTDGLWMVRTIGPLLEQGATLTPLGYLIQKDEEQTQTPQS